MIVPLLVLMAKKPRARNVKGVTIDELFLKPPLELGPTPKAPQQKASWFWFFRVVDEMLRAAEPFFPKTVRERAIARAVAWTGERLNGEDGLGAIYPAMANSVMMYDARGYPENDPQRAVARRSVERLLVIHDDETYCQPCVSPIWDTGLACHALMEVGGDAVNAKVKRGLDWLVPMQVLDVRGDWIARRPDLRPGGWAFDMPTRIIPTSTIPRWWRWRWTACIICLCRLSDRDRPRARMDRRHAERERRRGAFDADNEFYYLNNIPFADHGALLDPPTDDVTARCLRCWRSSPEAGRMRW